MLRELPQLMIDCLRSPKEYTENIIKNNQTKHQLLLLVLIGITSVFTRNIDNYMNGDLTLINYLLISIFAGGIFGWMGLYFYSYVIGLTGVLV